MRANRTLEIGTGLFVLLGFSALLFLTVQLPANGLKLGAPKAALHRGFHRTFLVHLLVNHKVGRWYPPKRLISLA